MACIEPNEEWTIETVTDARPNRPSTTQILVFCLSIDQGMITGEVADGVTGQVLSLVKGTRESLGRLGLDEASSLMTLNFSNGPARVMMSGVTFLRNFRGRFTSFVDAQVAAMGSVSEPGTASPFVPSDGDTGTGTGSQT